MARKFVNQVKRQKKIWILTIVFLTGAFLRCYHFSSWLHFELDQARDAALINKAIVSGPEKLPLLGPRAAGTFLRLGPASYYIEYLFALIFGNNPVGVATAILFFSFLSLPMSFWFFRKGFSEGIALALAAVFASSLFLVTYSRFAWNPNFLPFFVIAFLGALLKTVDNDKKKRGEWLVATSLLFGLLSQFHFLALIILSLTAAIFLVVKRVRIGIKYWVAAALAFSFLYIPVIINEAKTGGENSRQFLMAVQGKSSSRRHSFLEKVYRNVTENVEKNWIIITGSQTAELPKLKQKKEVDFQCGRECRQHLPEGITAALFFFVGSGLLLGRKWLFPKKKGIAFQNDFFLLNAILFLISFLIFLPLSFKFSPRFFLVIIPLPFIFLGLILEKLREIMPNKKGSIVVGVTLITPAIGLNLFFTGRFFSQLHNAVISPYQLPPDRILKQKTRITLEQEKKITALMARSFQENGYPVLYKGQSEFHRAFAYLLDKKGIPRDGLKITNICRQANYFLIFRRFSDHKRLLRKYQEKFVINRRQTIGTLTVFFLSPKAEAINCDRPDESRFRTYENEGGAVAKRYTWGEIF